MGAVDDFLAKKKLPPKPGTVVGYKPISSAPAVQPAANPPWPGPSASGPMPSQADIGHGALGQDAPIDDGKWAPTYSGTPRQEAKDNVDLEYNQRLRALQQASDQLGRGYDQSINVERQYGREVDPRLAQIYGALGNSLQQNAGMNQDTYGSAIDKIRGYYDEAGQANQALNTDVLARITGDAERLGTEAALPGGTERLTRDFAFNQSQNNNAKAGRSSNLAQLMAQIGVMDQGRVGAAASEGAQQRATLQNSIAQTVGQLGVEGFEELGQYRNQMNGLEQDRATANRDELARITQQRFENDTMGKKNALDEFMQRAGLNMNQAQLRGDNYRDNRDFVYNQDQTRRENVRNDSRWGQEFSRGNYESDRNHQLARDQFTLDKTSTQAQIDNQKSQLQMEQSRLQAEIAQTQDPIQKKLLQAQLDQTIAETNRIQHETAASPAAAKYPPGEIGVTQFLNSNNPAWGANGAGPEFRKMVSSVIPLVSDALAQASEEDSQLDPLNLVNQIYNEHPEWKQYDLSLLKQAVQIYLSGV